MALNSQVVANLSLSYSFTSNFLPNISLKKFFSEQETSLLKEGHLPSHIAIIMDGNRRWAKKKLFSSPLWRGHSEGAKVLLDVVLAAKEAGVKTLTAFGFSTENWSRSKTEVEMLFNIYEQYLKENQQFMVEQGVRFHFIGEIDPFPSSLKKQIRETLDKTKKGRGIDFVVALNYGGRDELRRAALKLLLAGLEGNVKPEEITEEKFASFLDTASFSDPDLLIRTSGEMRLSNFLLWQTAYSEHYVTELLWPDFSPQELLKALLVYQKRERRKGR